MLEPAPQTLRLRPVVDSKTMRVEAFDRGRGRDAASGEHQRVERHRPAIGQPKTAGRALYIADLSFDELDADGIENRPERYPCFVCRQIPL